eukprot:scaffold4331_cov400-Prasinococcus_capsulatus_cf.AAC.1
MELIYSTGVSWQDIIKPDPTRASPAGLGLSCHAARGSPAGLGPSRAAREEAREESMSLHRRRGARPCARAHSIRPGPRSPPERRLASSRAASGRPAGMEDRYCINAWSGPRCLSTSLMYSWAQRSDTAVLDEPLYANYIAQVCA